MRRSLLCVVRIRACPQGTRVLERRAPTPLSELASSRDDTRRYGKGLFFSRKSWETVGYTSAMGYHSAVVCFARALVHISSPPFGATKSPFFLLVHDSYFPHESTSAPPFLHKVRKAVATRHHSTTTTTKTVDFRSHGVDYKQRLMIFRMTSPLAAIALPSINVFP